VWISTDYYVGKQGYINSVVRPGLLYRATVFGDDHYKQYEIRRIAHTKEELARKANETVQQLSFPMSTKARKRYRAFLAKQQAVVEQVDTRVRVSTKRCFHLVVTKGGITL